MKHSQQSSRLGRGGFTITELLIASALSVTVMALAMTIFITLFGNWRNIQRRMEADSDVNIALSRMVYGMDDKLGLRSASSVSVKVNYVASSNGWTVSYSTGGLTPQNNSFTYSPTDKTLIFNPDERIAGRNIDFATVIKGMMSLVVTMGVAQVDGVLLNPPRQVGTEIFFRNY